MCPERAQILLGLPGWELFQLGLHRCSPVPVVQSKGSPREQVSSLLCLIFPLHFPRQGPQLTSFISSEGLLRDIALGCISAVPERRKVPISFFFFFNPNLYFSSSF